MSDEPIICSNPQCKVSETGRCFEGIETAECPHFGTNLLFESDSESTQEEDAAAETADVPELQRDVLRLPAGTALSNIDAAKLLCGGECRVIGIVGAHDAGKTSLIAGLYDLFQGGPVAGVEFAGSQSLWDFELACHDTRGASRRSEPDMGRTSRGEPKFFHLSVRPESGGEKIELALANRAGEDYIGSMHEHAMATAFYEISRADTLTLLIDGERLVDSGTRHNVKHEVKMLLEAFRTAGIVSGTHRLALTLTKLDAVERSPAHEAAMSFYDGIVTNVRTKFSDVFSEIAQFKVAASPKNGVSMRGLGLAELVTFWLDGKQEGHSYQVQRPTYVGQRAFARLTPLPDEAANG